MAKRDEGASVTESLTCGLVMPISAIEGCSAEHWAEVKSIICDAVDAVEDLNFIPKLVSEQDDVGVIQKRIVQNIYSSDIVVCDVSCKNANVMFELGMRLAFDKPTILVKDDKTEFSFDTGVIEHLVYPRDLRFSRIVGFKKALSDKIIATYRASLSDPNHSTFLKNFGSFKVAALTQTEGTPDQVMLDMLQDIARDVSRLKRSASFIPHTKISAPTGIFEEANAAFQNFRTDTGFSGSPHELIGDEYFYSSMESRVSLSSFSSRKEFIDFVDGFLLTVAR